ncbi:MAG TPA: GAF domain-containing protein [Phototrophicaceae bacterium]|nr:GAF domain-containing protein [Phototrophicaceae bacterium]
MTLEKATEPLQDLIPPEPPRDAAETGAQAEEARAAELDAFRVTLADRLRPFSDPVAIQAEASRLIGEFLRVNRVAYVEIVGDGAIIRQDYVSGLPSMTGHFLLKDFGATTIIAALRRGETLVVSDITTYPGLSAAELLRYARLGIRSFIVIPLVKAGQWVAIIGLAMVEPRVWSSAEIALAEEVAERTWAAVERAHAENALADDLKDMQILLNLSTRLVSEDNLQVFYDETLNAATALLHSEMGSIQVYYPERDQLRMLAWKGFSPEAVAFWEWIDLYSRTSCSAALRVRKRVIVPDFEASDFMAGSKDLEQFRRFGIRSAQTTPLISRGGHLLGMISTHWREVHQPSDHELRLLDLLARQVADLLERARAETALRESEAKYRLLFNTMDEGYILVQVLFDEHDQPVDMLYLDANPAAVRMTGTELVGKTTRHLDPNYEQHWYETFGRVAKTGIAERHEYRAEPLHAWYDFYVFKVGEPGSRRVAAIYQDITQRKQMEAAEHQQRQFSETLRDTALALTSSLDVAEVTDHILANIGRIVPHDAALLLLLDGDMVSVERARGTSALDAALETDLQGFQITLADVDHIDHMLRTNGPILRSRWEDHCIWDQAPGMAEMRSLVAAPILERETVVGFLLLLSRTPNFFVPEHASLLQTFAAQAAIAIQNAHAHEGAQALAVVNERHRLARELHDAVTQTLFSANMIADTLPRLWDNIPDPARTQLEQLQMLTRGALAEMRTLLLELRPEYLANMDLEAQIRQLLDALRARKRMNIQFTAQTEGLVPSAVRIAFYRIAQEALNNVVKHAHASEVRVTLEARQNHLRLVVQDNGLGFSQKGTPTGLGLNFMTERADEVGAQIDIATLPKVGTRITVTWGEAKEDGDGLPSASHSRSDR